MSSNVIKALKRVLPALSCTFVLAASAGHASAQDVEPVWSNVQKAGVLRCGAAIAPPYVTRDPKTGEYGGFFADLCRDFAENVLKVKAEFVDTTWDNLVAGLQSGKWDLSLALNRTPARALAVTFSHPASQYEISLAYNKGNPKIPADARSIAEIDKPDVTLAVMSGTAQDKAISAIVKKAKILRLPSADETRLAVISKRADMVVDASDTNWLFVRANPDWAVAMTPVPALAKQGVAFGLRRTVAPADLEVLNIFLEEKIATGAMDQLIEKAVDQLIKGGATK